MANSGYVPSQRTQDELEALRTEVSELKAKDAIAQSGLAYSLQIEGISWALMFEDYAKAVEFQMEETGSDEYSALAYVWDNELGARQRAAYEERAKKLQRVMKVWAA